MVVSLVLPAGYAFNHDGSCLYYATVSVFLAQALGIHLAIAQQLELLGIMLITSMGGAGVAGSAIVMLATTLSATGAIPVTAVGLILGVHRLLSSAFVPVNVLGNSVATLVVARMEDALDRARLETELMNGANPQPRHRLRGRIYPSRPEYSDMHISLCLDCCGSGAAAIALPFRISATGRHEHSAN